MTPEKTAGWCRRWLGRRRRRAPQGTWRVRPARNRLVLVAGGAGPHEFAWKVYHDARLGPIRVPARWQMFFAGDGVSFMDRGSGCALFIQHLRGAAVPHHDAPARRIRGCKYGRLGSTAVARAVGNLGADSTQYTRDYLLFTPAGTVLVGAHAPLPERYLLGLVVDAVVGSATLPGLRVVASPS